MRNRRAIGAVLVIAVAVIAGAFVGMATSGQASGTTGAHVAPVTVTSTATVTMRVPVPLSTQWAEDSLPRELDTWTLRTGADLWGPSRADALAPGHVGCWAAVTRAVTRVMCPDGYRADRYRMAR